MDLRCHFAVFRCLRRASDLPSRCRCLAARVKVRNMQLTCYFKVYALLFLVKVLNVGAVRRRVEVQMSGPQIEGLGQQYTMNPTLSALVVGSLLSEHPALAAGLMGMYQTPKIRLPDPQSPILAGKSYAPAYSFNAVPAPKYVPANYKPYYAGPAVTFDVEERPRR